MINLGNIMSRTLRDEGRLSGAKPLVCENDDEAIEKAKSLLNGTDIELWSGPRFVVRLKRKPE
jgi:hypothetical protein